MTTTPWNATVGRRDPFAWGGPSPTGLGQGAAARMAAEIAGVSYHWIAGDMKEPESRLTGLNAMHGECKSGSRENFITGAAIEKDCGEHVSPEKMERHKLCLRAGPRRLGPHYAAAGVSYRWRGWCCGPLRRRTPVDFRKPRLREQCSEESRRSMMRLLMRLKPK